MRAIWASIRRHKAGNILIVFTVVQAACVAAYFLFPDRFAYLDKLNVEVMLKSIPPLAILATGVGLLMIAGEFDLSVGSNFALAAFIMARAYDAGMPVWPAVLLALLTGALVGFVNGLITLRAGIPSFIVTLGTMMFWRGIVIWVSGKITLSFAPEGAFESVFAGSAGWLQAQFIWAVAVAVLAHMLLERHKLGNHIFAVGGNKESAIAIGVNPNAVKMICFILVGVLTAFAAVMTTARMPSISPEQGKSYELQAIAACVIGGLSLTGGQGSILGIFLGSALFFTIHTVLLLLQVPGDYMDSYVGALIIIAAVFNKLTKKEKYS